MGILEIFACRIPNPPNDWKIQVPLTKPGIQSSIKCMKETLGKSILVRSNQREVRVIAGVDCRLSLIHSMKVCCCLKWATCEISNLHHKYCNLLQFMLHCYNVAILNSSLNPLFFPLLSFVFFFKRFSRFHPHFPFSQFQINHAPG